MYNKTTYLLLLIIILQLSADDRVYINNIVNFKTKVDDVKTLKEIPFPINHYRKTNDKIPSTILVSHFILDHMFIPSIIENHRKYAKTHGYDYWFRNGIIEHNFTNLKQNYINNPAIFFGLQWQKFTAIKQAMDIMNDSEHKYEWIMWLDGVVAFTDFNKSLGDLMQEINVNNKDYFIITKDISCNKHNICKINYCIDSGVLLIRNNTQGRHFIQNIIDSFPIYKDRLPLPEQAAVQDQIFGLPIHQENGTNNCNIPPIAGIRIIEPAVMNSRYTEGFPYWKSGDFINHFTWLPPKVIYETYIMYFFSCISKIKSNKDLNKCEYIYNKPPLFKPK